MSDAILLSNFVPVQDYCQIVILFQVPPLRGGVSGGGIVSKKVREPVECQNLQPSVNTVSIPVTVEATTGTCAEESTNFST